MKAEKDGQSVRGKKGDEFTHDGCGGFFGLFVVFFEVFGLDELFVWMKKALRNHKMMCPTQYGEIKIQHLGICRPDFRT